MRRRDWEGRSGKSGGVGEAGSRFSSLGCCLAMGDLSWLRFGFSPKWVLESILRWAITTDAPRSIRSASVPPVEGVRVDTGKTEASRISSATLHGVVFQNPMIPTPLRHPRRGLEFLPPNKECPLRSAAVAEQPQQHQEEVDEVEIEPQRAHDRLPAGDGAVVVGRYISLIFCVS